MKGAIVLESYRDGVSVADVARKHGISGPQLHAWRRAAREGLLPMPDADRLGLMPVVVSSGGDEGDNGGQVGAIQVNVAGVRICIEPGFDPDHLGRVIAAVRAAT